MPAELESCESLNSTNYICKRFCEHQSSVYTSIVSICSTSVLQKGNISGTFVIVCHYSLVKMANAQLLALCLQLDFGGSVGANYWNIFISYI